MRLVCIADTHGFHDRLKIPEGDMLIHAGDFSRQSTVHDLTDFMAWFAGTNNRHPVKITVAGNHDTLFQTHPELVAALIPAGVTYLQDSGCRISVSSPFRKAIASSRSSIASLVAALLSRTTVKSSVGRQPGQCNKAERSFSIQSVIPPFDFG
jgi:hypothetical protein